MTDHEQNRRRTLRQLMLDLREFGAQVRRGPDGQIQLATDKPLTPEIQERVTDLEDEFHWALDAVGDDEKP